MIAIMLFYEATKYLEVANRPVVCYIFASHICLIFKWFLLHYSEVLCSLRVKINIHIQLQIDVYNADTFFWRKENVVFAVEAPAIMLYIYSASVLHIPTILYDIILMCWFLISYLQHHHPFYHTNIFTLFCH